MELQRLVNGFIRKAWLIAVLMVLGGVVSFYLSYSNKPSMYSSEMSMYIVNPDKKLLGEAPANADLQVNRQLLNDYIQIVYSRKVYEYAIREMGGINISESTFNSIIGADVGKESSIIRLSAEWTDPDTAATIVEVTGRALRNAVKDIINMDNLEVIDEPTPSNSPTTASKSKSLIVGVLAGLILALGIIYILELLDNKLRSVNEIEKALGLSVVGIIPETKLR